MDTPEFWRDLRADFEKIQNGADMYADAHFGLGGADDSAQNYFHEYAKRGGLALGAAPDDAFRIWLTAVADYLKRTHHRWLHRPAFSQQTLIPLGHDQYTRAATDGWLIIEADVWVEHVCEASAQVCTALETESYAQQVPASPIVQSPATTPSAAAILENPAGRRTAVIDPLLKQRGLTRSKWAAKAGVDPSVVYDYLAGKSNPRPESRQALAEVIQIPDLPE